MSAFESIQTTFSYFYSEAVKYDAINGRMDEQFKNCVTANRLGCKIPRDILPYCGKIFTITKLVFDLRDQNAILFNNWTRIIQHLCQNEGVTVERHGLPPIHLNFPLSRKILKGKDLTFDKISILDPSDKETLARVIKYSLPFTNQSCGYCVFSEESQRMMFEAPNTLCAYSTTTSGRITSVVWGIWLQIGEASCFYMLFAAREPEYCGQHIYEKMLNIFRPLLTDADSRFKSHFLCWKQGKENAINNNALLQFENILGTVSRSDGEAYSFEASENCFVSIDPQSTIPIPRDVELEEALKEYALKAGNLLRFAFEFPVLMFKLNVWWNLRYKQEYPTPLGYPNSLKPI